MSGEQYKKLIITDEEQKQILLKELEFLHNICLKNNIKYFLAYGTLLGSIRHSGFIPWDDDIDVWMFRKEYEKLVAYFKENDTGNFRLYDIYNTKDYYAHMTKIADKRTYLKEKAENAIPIGVYLDVFIIDDLSNNLNKANRLQKRMYFYREVLYLKNIMISPDRNQVKNVILKMAKFFLKPLNREKLLRILDEKSQIYNLNKCSKYCGAISSQIYGSKEIMLSKWFEDSKLGIFEGQEVCLPVEYDKILEHLYGDYMKLPPEEKRITHHDFVAYWR